MNIIRLIESRSDVYNTCSKVLENRYIIKYYTYIRCRLFIHALFISHYDIIRKVFRSQMIAKNGRLNINIITLILMTFYGYPWSIFDTIMFFLSAWSNGHFGSSYDFKWDFLNSITMQVILFFHRWFVVFVLLHNSNKRV